MAGDRARGLLVHPRLVFLATGDPQQVGVLLQQPADLVVAPGHALCLPSLVGTGHYDECVQY
jgi:hypothetical protein